MKPNIWETPALTLKRRSRLSRLLWVKMIFRLQVWLTSSAPNELCRTWCVLTLKSIHRSVFVIDGYQTNLLHLDIHDDLNTRSIPRRTCIKEVRHICVSKPHESLVMLSLDYLWTTLMAGKSAIRFHLAIDSFQKLWSAPVSPIIPLKQWKWLEICYAWMTNK